MSSLPIAYVDIRFCAHATENEDKVIKAAYNVLANEEPEEITFTKTNVEGHYGNPIIFFETRTKDKKIIKKLIENLSTNLSSLDKNELTNTIDKCVEKGSLYIRLDKQAAYQNKIKLVTSDPIRIRIRFNKTKTENVTLICKELGILT